MSCAFSISTSYDLDASRFVNSLIPWGDGFLVCLVLFDFGVFFVVGVFFLFAWFVFFCWHGVFFFFWLLFF